MGMIVGVAEAGVPDHLKGRVGFMNHDLFEPQTVLADVYLFRMVLCNWCDNYAAKILKAQIPALRPGPEVFVQDACMPEPDAVPLWRERYLDEWKALLAMTDERFVLHQVFVPKNSLLTILEIHWEERDI
ncbi:hypothetical protein B0I35DRAFT_476525 [Stachybotrys elegans]|uniref:O-methyltransferase C-terminal domain-containing protein n=1 Tax=Stachybotrys elegans TaxID=80388 RepID=A0A8K0WSN9_9HYPO|nr:hypothetical protein B0I35DRAFT_476525 [Stachybotrys elegans]